MLSDVMNGLKGESSNDWVFETSKDRKTGCYLGDVEV